MKCNRYVATERFMATNSYNEQVDNLYTTPLWLRNFSNTCEVVNAASKVKLVLHKQLKTPIFFIPEQRYISSQQKAKKII